MDKETKMMFNTILEEMGRMEERTNKRFDMIDKRFDIIHNELESLHHEVNACKLEKESIGLMIKRLDQHEERIGKLEEKTA